MDSLIGRGIGIVAIAKHWLWPYELYKLSCIHLDYDATGVADGRLNEGSSGARGCGHDLEEIFWGGSNWRHYFRSTMWDETFVGSDKGDNVCLRRLPALSGSGQECLPGAFVRTGALGYRVSVTWSCYCDGGLQCTPCRQY